MFELMTMPMMRSYNPFRELDRFERMMFGEMMPKQEAKNMTKGIRTDITDNGNEYLLDAELPGFNKEDITLNIEGDTLVITAKHEDNNEEKKDNYLRRERYFGEYRRSFDISGIEADEISAKYNNGVLTVNLPKKQEQLPASRRLEIQ